ncbi:MAG: cyclic nucleotide-binding/CBS domain-containing protein [Rubricella sp.]
MAEEKRSMKLKDRPEYNQKPKPLTAPASMSVAEGVALMADLNYGSIMIVDGDDKLEGVVTERDILKRLVNQGRDAKSTTLGDIMTANPRVAREDDDLLDWLRVMSNERFRRLPVVDDEGRVISVFTQGDFVSYTWPELIYQAQQMVKATMLENFPVLLIGGGIALYTIVMAIIFNTF